MFDTVSGRLHLAPYSFEDWVDFTVEHQATTLHEAATLASKIAIEELTICGRWLLETMSSVVGDAVGYMFAALQSLKRLHIYEFPPHVPDTVAAGLPYLTALTELISENPNCPLTHRNVNTVLSACRFMPTLRKVQLPYYLQDSKGATEVCEILGALQHIACLNMHGCFRGVMGSRSLGGDLGSGVLQGEEFFELPQVVASCLGKLSNLRSLELTECFEGQDLEGVMQAIGSMQQLTQLSLARVECCTKRMTMHFAGIFAFTLVRRSACIGIKPMLQQLPGLLHLDLSGLLMPSEDHCTATAIACMTDLTVLCLSAVEVDPGFWHTLTSNMSLSKLVSLDLSKVESIDASSMSRFADAMACMHKMEDLHLTGTHVGTAAAAVFKAIRGMPRLQKLGMGQCNISCGAPGGGPAIADELACLSTLSNLQTLIVAFNDLGTAPQEQPPSYCVSVVLECTPDLQLVQGEFQALQV